MKPSTKDRSPYVYAIFDQQGTLLYVGQSGSIQNRWADHRRKLKHPNSLFRSRFYSKLQAHTTSAVLPTDKQIELILTEGVSYFRCDSGLVYVAMEVPSKELADKMEVALIESAKPLYNKHYLIKPKRQPVPQTNIRRPGLMHPVRRNDSVVFNSVTQAAKASGIAQSTLSNHLRGVLKTAGGFTFQKLEKRA